MEANADSFLELLHQFEDFTDAVSPDQAHNEFDETTLQLFWMRWPHAVRGNVGAVHPAHRPGTR
jgi:hypothetical protein